MGKGNGEKHVKLVSNCKMGQTMFFIYR